MQWRNSPRNMFKEKAQLLDLKSLNLEAIRVDFNHTDSPEIMTLNSDIIFKINRGRIGT
jgi:hypothetical protein